MKHHLAVLALVALALPPHAAHGGPSEAAPPAPGAGVKAHLDPRSGRMLERPAKVEAGAQPGGPRAPDFSRMREEHLPDGTVLLHPEGQLRTVSVVHRSSDGSFAAACEATPVAPEPPR